MFKKCLSVMLALVLLAGIFSVVPFPASAAASGTTGDCTWTLDENGTLIISGNGAIGDYEATSVKPWGTGIKQLFIENGVTSIGKYAFYMCSGLKRISFPDSVERINYRAFSRCSSLSEIDMPDSVIRIDSDVFENTQWYKDQPDGLIYIGKIAYKYKGTVPETVTIKDGTLGIAGDSFYLSDKLKYLNLPEGLLTIGDCAFKNCSRLESPVFPSSLREIGSTAFCDCYSIDSVSIPSGVKEIESLAFAGSGIKSIQLPGGLKKIGDQAFEDCMHLTKIDIPYSVSEIGKLAFKSCLEIREVRIPSNVTAIRYGTFRYCTKLSTIYIPDSVTRIEEVAFGGTEWYQNQPDGFVYAGKVLYKCKGNLYENVVVPSSVSGIAASAFWECTNLKSVILHDNLTELGDNTFYGCTGLTSVSLPKNLKIIEDGVFSGCTNLETLVIPDTVTSIGSKAFSDCTKLSKLEMGDQVENLGSNAFLNCRCLTSFKMPASLTRIKSSLFKGCSRLTSIEIPYGVTVIGANAFMDCTYLSDVSIPLSVEKIEKEAFSNCSSLSEISVPSSVTNIASYALGYNYNSTKGTHTARSNFVILGKKNSAAHSYAKTNNFTFYADNRILWGNGGALPGVDNLSFINSGDNFVKGETQKNYIISQKSLDRLTNKLYKPVRESIEDYAAGDWGGSCYGMSVVVSLMKGGYLTPSFYDDAGTAQKAYDLASPVASDKVMDLINFYHLSQLMPDVQEQRLSTTGESDLLRKAVEDARGVKRGNLPTVLCFSWRGEDFRDHDVSSLEEKQAAIKANESLFTDRMGSRYCFSEDQVDSMTESGGRTYITTNGVLQEIVFRDNGNTVQIYENGTFKKAWHRVASYGHAITAYDLKEFRTNSDDNMADNGVFYKYRLTIYDPNVAEPTYLWISEDYTDWYYHHMSLNASTNTKYIMVDGNGKEDKLLTGVISDYKILNIRNLENTKDYVTSKNICIPIVVILNEAPFSLSTAGGNTYTVSGDTLADNGGLRKTYNMGAAHIGEYSAAQAVYSLPEDDAAQQPLTITPLKTTDRMDVQLQFSEYSFGAAAGYAKRITADPVNGTVSLKSAKSDYSLSTTFNSGCSLPWYTLKVSGRNATASSLKIESDGIVLTSDSLHSVNAKAKNASETVAVSFNTDKGSVKFVDQEDGTLGVYVDNDNNGTYETPIAASGAEQPSFILGDADGDGKVTILDVTAIQRSLAGIATKAYHEEAADANGDESISVLDATAVQRWLAGLPTNDRIGKTT